MLFYLLQNIMDSLDLIETHCKLLYDSYTNNGNIQRSLEYLIESLKSCSNYHHMNISNINIVELTNFFQIIGEIFNINFKILISDGKEQIIKETNLNELFSNIRDNNVHQIINNDNIYSCEFHKESLFQVVSPCTP